MHHQNLCVYLLFASLECLKGERNNKENKNDCGEN